METENRCLDLPIVMSLVSCEKTCFIEKWGMELECRELESLSGGEVETIINTNTHTTIIDLKRHFSLPISRK